MNEIIKITYRLTLSCLVAAFFMGTVFTVTDAAKKHNEHMNVQKTMYDLLGYGKKNPPPPELALHSVYRYNVQDDNKKYLGYMVPVKKGGETERYELIRIDLEGNYVDRQALDIAPEAAIEAPERQKALKEAVEASQTFTYADSFIVARLGEKRAAYLLPGEFPGYKTFISVMLALDPSYEVIGLEIMEHEEDPGLGADIEQDFFKGQFKGKSFEKIAKLDVIKEPLPDEYRAYLESQGEEKPKNMGSDLEEIRKKYLDSDVYALTGATISSRAVTNGVKGIVRKFSYRINTLDSVVNNQAIPVAF